MNKTESITFRINQKLKEDYKKAIRADRTAANMTDDLIRYIDRKVKRQSRINEDK